MSVYGIENTQPFYPALDGTPLQGGSVWFGVAGQNPVTNPQAVYSDSAGTQPLAQPVAISRGRTVDQYGNSVNIYVAGDFSRLVQDGQGRQLLFQSSQPQTMSASSASGSATTATTQAGLATTAKVGADTAKTAAEAARDATLAAAAIYVSTTAGLAATASGAYFYVPSSAANESLILYRNTAGAAVEVKRYPSKVKVDAAADLAVIARSALSLRPTIRPPATFFKKRASLSADPQYSNHGYTKDTAAGSLYDTSNGVYKPFPNSTIQIIAHGDSLTWGGTTGLNENYVTRLVRSLYNRGTRADVKNRGINGQGFNYVYSGSGVANNLLNDAAGEVDAAMSAAKTNYLVIWAGTNDAVLGGRTAAQINTDATAYVDARIAAGWSASRICIVTMLPRQTFDEPTRATINANFAALAVSRATKIARVDQNGFIGAAGQQNNATYFLDQIHLTDLGQSIAESIIEGVLFP